MLYFIYSFKFMSSTFDHFNVKRHYLKWIIIINWNFQGKCEIWGKSHSQGQQQPTYQKAKKGIYLLNKAPIKFILHIDSKFYWLFFNFTKQHLRSAISYNYHWTLQSEFSFLLCQVINMKKWKYWAGFFLLALGFFLQK